MPLSRNSPTDCDVHDLSSSVSLFGPKHHDRGLLLEVPALLTTSSCCTIHSSTTQSRGGGQEQQQQQHSNLIEPKQQEEGHHHDHHHHHRRRCSSSSRRRRRRRRRDKGRNKDNDDVASTSSSADDNESKNIGQEKQQQLRRRGRRRTKLRNNQTSSARSSRTTTTTTTRRKNNPLRSLSLAEEDESTLPTKKIKDPDNTTADDHPDAVIPYYPTLSWEDEGVVGDSGPQILLWRSSNQTMTPPLTPPAAANRSTTTARRRCSTSSSHGSPHDQSLLLVDDSKCHDSHTSTTTTSGNSDDVEPPAPAVPSPLDDDRTVSPGIFRPHSIPRQSPSSSPIWHDPTITFSRSDDDDDGDEPWNDNRSSALVVSSLTAAAAATDQQPVTTILNGATTTAIRHGDDEILAAYDLLPPFPGSTRKWLEWGYWRQRLFSSQHCCLPKRETEPEATLNTTTTTASRNNSLGVGDAPQLHHPAMLQYKNQGIQHNSYGDYQQQQQYHYYHASSPSQHYYQYVTPYHHPSPHQQPLVVPPSWTVTPHQQQRPHGGGYNPHGQPQVHSNQPWQPQQQQQQQVHPPHQPKSPVASTNHNTMPMPWILQQQQPLAPSLISPGLTSSPGNPDGRGHEGRQQQQQQYHSRMVSNDDDDSMLMTTAGNNNDDDDNFMGNDYDDEFDVPSVSSLEESVDSSTWRTLDVMKGPSHHHHHQRRSSSFGGLSASLVLTTTATAALPTTTATPTKTGNHSNSHNNNNNKPPVVPPLPPRPPLPSPGNLVTASRDRSFSEASPPYRQRDRTFTESSANTTGSRHRRGGTVCEFSFESVSISAAAAGAAAAADGGGATTSSSTSCGAGSTIPRPRPSSLRSSSLPLEVQIMQVHSAHAALLPQPLLARASTTTTTSTRQQASILSQQQQRQPPQPHTPHSWALSPPRGILQDDLESPEGYISPLEEEHFTLHTTRSSTGSISRTTTATTTSPGDRIKSPATTTTNSSPPYYAAVANGCHVVDSPQRSCSINPQDSSVCEERSATGGNDEEDCCDEKHDDDDGASKQQKRNKGGLLIPFEETSPFAKLKEPPAISASESWMWQWVNNNSNNNNSNDNPCSSSKCMPAQVSPTHSSSPNDTSINLEKATTTATMTPVKYDTYLPKNDALEQIWNDTATRTTMSSNNGIALSGWVAFGRGEALKQKLAANTGTLEQNDTTYLVAPNASSKLWLSSSSPSPDKVNNNITLFDSSVDVSGCHVQVQEISRQHGQAVVVQRHGTGETVCIILPVCLPRHYSGTITEDKKCFDGRLCFPSGDYLPDDQQYTAMHIMFALDSILKANHNHPVLPLWKY